MIIRALDGTGDWQFGKGKQSYNYKTDAIAENVSTRLNEFLNDCFFNMGAGLDWLRLLGDKNTMNEIVLTLRSKILQSEGVVRVNSIDAKMSGRRSLTVSYNIDTIYTQNFNQSLEVVNVQF